MTIKRKRIYEIIIIGLVIILTSLCAYMGITAIQKSMKLNLSFTASPVVYCQMKIGEELVFDNLSSQIGDGVENLSGNTLTFNQDKLASTIGVESFSLTLKNYNETGSSILVEFENATISGKTGYSEIIASGNSSTFAVTPLNLVGISMTKVTPVTLSLGAGVTLTSSNILTSTSGAQCLPFGEDLQATISLESSYENPKFTFNGNTYTITNNQLTIPAEDLTGGDVSVEVEAEQQGYTITFNANGGKFADSSTTYSEIVTAGANYSLPTAPTKDGYSFLGWAESSSATEATWSAEEQTANKVTTWYAVWVRVYNVTVNINICTIDVETTVWEFELCLNDSVPFTVTKSVSMSSNMASYRIDNASGILVDDVQLAVSKSGALATVTLTFNSLINVTSDIVIDVIIAGTHEGGS